MLGRYADGLFGIADMWTDTVDELDYVVFLNKLYRRVTVRVFDRETNSWVPRWKELRAVQSMLPLDGTGPALLGEEAEHRRL